MRLKSGTPCPDCGANGFHTNYSGDIGERMKLTGECFECAFWEIQCKKPPKIVIDHHVYGIGTEPGPNANRSFLGMAGRRFDIEIDGKVYTTHNLWSGGTIPERYWERLPDTAKFHSGKREQSGDITCWNPADERQPAFPAYTGK